MSDTQVTMEPGRQDIVITRVFDAPRDIVFKAITDPELIPRWWGSSRFTTEVEHMDVRAGGHWRFSTSRETDDAVYRFYGVYHDVTPDRIVSTLEFESGGPGQLQLVVDTFETLGGGRTLYRSVALFQSVADRDGWVPTGMQDGIRESMDMLAGVIGELQ